MFSDANVNGKFMYKMEAGMCIANVTAFFVLVIEITSFKFKNAVSLLYPVLGCDYCKVVRNNLHTNLIRKD